MKTISPRISKFVACYCQSYRKFSLDLVVGAAVSVGQCWQVFPCSVHTGGHWLRCSTRPRLPAYQCCGPLNRSHLQ